MKSEKEMLTVKLSAPVCELGDVVRLYVDWRVKIEEVKRVDWPGRSMEAGEAERECGVWRRAKEFQFLGMFTVTR